MSNQLTTIVARPGRQ